MKIRARIESELYKSSQEVKRLEINFDQMNEIISGIGEEFPNLVQIHMIGYIELLDRHDFSNMEQLQKLTMEKFQNKVWPEDLIADLVNLTDITIINTKTEEIPKTFIKQQTKLKKLSISYNDYFGSIEMDLFKYNPNLEMIEMNKNKHLERISVNFTQLPVINQIDIRDNFCFNDGWTSTDDGPIESFQEKINKNCTLSDKSSV